MTDINNKRANLIQVEFWAVTTIFVFSVFFLISHTLNLSVTPNQGTSGVARAPFDYYFIANLIRYATLYLSFLLLNFVLVPKLLKKEALVQNIFLVVSTFLLVGFIFGITATHLKEAMLANFKMDTTSKNFLIQKNFLYALWLLLLFGFYSVIKYIGLYLLSRSEAIQTKYKFIAPGSLVAFIIWMIIMFILLAGRAPEEVSTAWAIVIPSGIILYNYSFYSLLPKSLSKKNPFRFYAMRVFLILLLALFPIWLIAFLFSGNEEAGAAITFFNAAVQFFITLPLTWILFKRHIKGNEEIYYLKKELGQSHANFDFLRSQINPHFLFNALNTIYGTALQEGAERTSEGIEKLGDMMRFMLQENMQDKIPLVRELDYLNNYISLQKLRTDTNPIVKIESHIEQQVSNIQIAPMLLIPFVENAFKHGISLREPSNIKISLEVKDKTIYFDVFNSKHAKHESDPEKDKSGIGLNNVKQRLQLLYKGKHELIIRETGKDFFVHLTIKLN